MLPHRVAFNYDSRHIHKTDLFQTEYLIDTDLFT